MNYDNTDLTKQLTLKWEDHKGISSLEQINQVKTGVYIWGFNNGDNFTPYYVGIAENIMLRLHEHIASILCGKYTIYHSDSLFNFSEYKNKLKQSNENSGIVYSPNWPYSLNEFLVKREYIFPHVENMINLFYYTYAEVDKELSKSSELKDIEKICINQIGIKNLANTRGGNSNKFAISHKGNSQILSLMNLASN